MTIGLVHPAVLDRRLDVDDVIRGCDFDRLAKFGISPKVSMAVSYALILAGTFHWTLQRGTGTASWKRVGQ